MSGRMDGRTAEIPMPGEREQQPFDDALLRAAPVIARLAAAAWLRAAEWTIGTSVRAAVRVVQGAARGETPADLLQGAEAELREWARQLLGIVNESTGNGAGPPAAPAQPDYVDVEATSLDGHVTDAELRERGAELLRRSADVEYDLDAHPAYARILSELAPDEARILRLLAQQGPRPAVDVRTGGAMGRLKSDLVAPGLTMIAAEAGVRHAEKLHPYMDNLSRLGLIAFSREQLEDLRLYQVLEAQPDVVEAMEKAGRGKTVRRSIELTTFGQDFCRTCLPMDTAEIEALTAQDTVGR
jgi:hypothetical protein